MPLATFERDLLSSSLKSFVISDSTVITHCYNCLLSEGENKTIPWPTLTPVHIYF